jgi:hypothetical protein
MAGQRRWWKKLKEGGEEGGKGERSVACGVGSSRKRE